MNQEKYKENIYKISYKYSDTHNSMTCIKDLSELQGAIASMDHLLELSNSAASKNAMWNKECDKVKDTIIRKIADVTISIDVLRSFFGIDDETLQRKMDERLQKDMKELEFMEEYHND